MWKCFSRMAGLCRRHPLWKPRTYGSYIRRIRVKTSYCTSGRFGLVSWSTQLLWFVFLEAQTTISYDDKAAGTDRVLPTSGATSYTGGLSVHKYIINIVARNKRGIKTRGPRDKKHSAAWRHERAREPQNCGLPDIYRMKTLTSSLWQLIFRSFRLQHSLKLFTWWRLSISHRKH